MKVTIFLNSLSLGGTEKAACQWARLLQQRGHKVSAVALEDGPRRADLEQAGISLHIPQDRNNPNSIAGLLQSSDVIHAHAPGFPHQGDILGQALRLLPRNIPVVQTNIFGQLRNTAEDGWTHFRLFISWTSCVQAARRAGRPLDLEFFRHQSVAVYPVEDPFGIMTNDELQMTDGRAQIPDMKSEHTRHAEAFRKMLGLGKEHVLFGRFSRPEPNKWTPLVLDAFLAAYRNNPNIRLLLREPPPAVAHHLISSGLATWFPSCNETYGTTNQEQGTRNDEPGTKNQPQTQPSVIRHSPCIILLRATPDPVKLTISQLACDIVLHTSSIGESFGYGLAEPMALGKPVITNSVPWHDQAQIELVQHGECGLIASTVPSMKAAILRMAECAELRVRWGESSRKRVLQIADPVESTSRVEMAIKCALEGSENPLAEQDLEKAIKTAENLDKHQWGHSLEEQLWLRSRAGWVEFMRWQRELRNRIG